mmetsp:Transcript_22065/g.36564  ORF Transcript_22065/g.36564 Transcript_22065/m.36564 type:complete len:171 (+) Transcript_22065:153-665(+)
MNIFMSNKGSLEQKSAETRHDAKVLELLQLTVEVLEEVESLRERHDGLAGIAKALVQLIKVGLKLQLSGGIEKGEVARDLLLCLQRARRVLQQLSELSPNYFGEFRPELYAAELGGLDEKILWLLAEADGELEMKADSSLASVDAPDVIHNFMARLFWTKHFGKEISSVP